MADILNFGNFSRCFKNLEIGTKISETFLNFDEKLFPVLTINPEILIEFISKIDKINLFRYYLNEKKGQFETLPWEKAIKRFCTFEIYNNDRGEEYKDIFELFTKYGISEKLFKKACDLREEQKKGNIPEHILGDELKENNKAKSFRYEFLSKYDPRNFIIGLYASCCATIAQTRYGGDIVRETILNRNVQNIVIIDKNNEIIAKGTLYIDPEKRYGLINDFEINEKYKKNESVRDGFYKKDNSNNDRYRQEIFNEFIIGIENFVQIYNEMHPEQHIIQINVGSGCNRLNQYAREYCEENFGDNYEDVYPNFKGPSCFYDARKFAQHIIYKEGIKCKCIEPLDGMCL